MNYYFKELRSFIITAPDFAVTKFIKHELAAINFVIIHEMLLLKTIDEY
jgi:hypothetical protein